MRIFFCIKSDSSYLNCWPCPDFNLQASHFPLGNLYLYYYFYWYTYVFLFVFLFVFVCIFDLVLTSTYKPRISRLSNTDQLQRNTVLQTFKASSKLRITTTNNKLQIFRTNKIFSVTQIFKHIKQTTNSEIPWSVEQDVQNFSSNYQKK